jgi:hypothetical protein
MGPVVLALDVDEVFSGVRELSKDLVKIDGERVHFDLSRQKSDGLGQTADGIDVKTFDDGGLGGVGRGYEQTVALLGDSLQTHLQHSFDGPGLAGQDQFADHGMGTRPVIGNLAAAQEQSQRNRQVEPAGIFLEVGWG